MHVCAPRRHRRSGGWGILCAAIALAAAPGSAAAQGAGSASLRGRVQDASGAVLAGATIALTNERTQAVRTQVSDARGDYVFAALLPDPYTTRVELAGFASWSSGEVRLSPGDSLHLDATLVVAGPSEEVTVESQRPLVRTDTGARDNVITAEQIRDLSIVGRGAMELLRILPGVVSDQSMETVSFDQGSNSLRDFSVNGQRGTQLNPVLDGSRIIDFGANSAVMTNINPDMVEEVKVQSSNYAAEYGSGTVQITAVTKGGSSSFHGSLYDYWRNWRFAANDRSNSYAGVPRPESNYNYPGITLSGPVLVPGTGFNRSRDRLFFFVGFELQEQTIDSGTTLGVVPTERQRLGDFSELLDGGGQNLGQPQRVTVPAGFPGAGELAPGNDLRPYLDRYGQGFLNLYPLPNYTDPDNRYNYALSTPLPLDRWQLVTRLDWNVSEATHAYVRLALEKERSESTRGVWGCCSNFELPSRAVADNKSWSVSASVTSVLSPSLTNEVVVSASQLQHDNDWQDPSRLSLSALGLSGYRGPFDNGSDEVPLSFLSFGQGLGNLDALQGLPLYAHNDSLTLADSLTKVASAHTLKLGVRVERGRKQQNFASSIQGQLYLGSTWMAGGTGNDYGDLLVGRVAQYNQSTAVPRGEWRFWNYEAFVQDTWKARRNLTLEVGLRVVKMPNNEELNGLGMLFEPSAYDRDQGPFIDGDPQRPNGVLLASRGEIPKGMTESPGVKAMPRLNFAWDVEGDGAWVLRGGAGLFYNRVMGSYQYFVQGFPPNTLNTSAFFWDVPGGLTISSLPGLDPARPAASWVDSLDSRSIHLPRTWTWSLGLARRLPWQSALEVAYVGNRQEHLPNRTIANYIPPGSLTGTVGNADLDNPLHRVALDAGVAASFRKFPAYLRNWWYQYEAEATYHGVQATLNRSAGRRVQYFLNYTFGKVLGTTGPQDFVVRDPLDPRNRTYGIPSWDRTHIFNGSYNLVLPDAIGPEGDGTFRSLLRGLLDGWQVSGITRYSSGTPFRVVFSGDLALEEIQRGWWGTDAHEWGYSPGNSGAITPVFSGNPQLGNTGVGEKLLDLDNIGIPAFGESGPFQSPYYLRSPSRWNWDVTLMKNFALGGSKRLQLRLGVFNLFNQAVPVLQNGDVDLNLQTECNVRVDGVPNGAGGYVDGVCDPTQGFHFTDLTLQNFGKIVTKHGHRVIEVVARFEF